MRSSWRRSLAGPVCGCCIPRTSRSRDKSRLRVAVSIVTAPFVPLEQALRQLGFADVVPFYDLAESFRAVHPLSNGWFADPLTPSDRTETAEVLARWTG